MPQLPHTLRLYNLVPIKNYSFINVTDPTAAISLRTPLSQPVIRGAPIIKINPNPSPQLNRTQ